MIETFVNYLRFNRGLSENTLRAYEQGLHDFARYMLTLGVGARWSTVTKLQIDGYVRDLVNRELEPATIKQRISALRTLYKTMMAMGAIKTNPARYVSTPKLNDSLPKVIERNAIAHALASPKVNIQTKAAIAIIFETGIRIQELLDLKPEDVNYEQQSIKILGKGNKERTVYFGSLTKQYIGIWKGSEHTQRELRQDIFYALRDFSNAEQLSPHAIRHTMATEMLNNGMSIEGISMLLGHKSIKTTEIYARLSNKQAQQQYLQFMPTLA